MYGEYTKAPPPAVPTKCRTTLSGDTNIVRKRLRTHNFRPATCMPINSDEGEGKGVQQQTEMAKCLEK